MVQREPRLLLRLAAEVGNMCLPCDAGSSGMKAAGLKEPLKEAMLCSVRSQEKSLMKWKHQHGMGSGEKPRQGTRLQDSELAPEEAKKNHC